MYLLDSLSDVAMKRHSAVRSCDGVNSSVHDSFDRGPVAGESNRSVWSTSSTVRTMRRPLGNMESALNLTRQFAPMTVAGVLRLRGAPRDFEVRAALDVLQARHPLLRSRIVNSRRRPSFEVSADVGPIQLDVRERRDETHWQDVVTEVINANLAVDVGPLVACTYIRDPAGDSAELVFAYDHAVMDATSATNLYRELLALCSTAASPNTTRAAALPPSIDQLLPARLTGASRVGPTLRYMRRQIADEAAYQRHIDGRAAPIQSRAGCRIVTRSLDIDTTTELVRRARRQRLTTNSVIAAALIVATHRNLHPEDSLPMRAITFADLRPALRPPPPPDSLGCYISMLRHTLQVGPQDDLWSISRTFQDQLRQSLDRDEHLVGAQLARHLMRMTISLKRVRMATTAVSYAGPLSLEGRYGEIEVVGVHGFISNNRLGPVSTAFAKIFDGCLSWDFVFLDTDMDAMSATAIADGTTAELSVAATL
jgi:hypothetical protein